MILRTPPMGWNSWNTFASDINEELIMGIADKIVELGFAECGYNYVVIDDCWSLEERDPNGRLVANPEKFPHGMKYLADYIHSKGLKFGMYSCAGTMTCAGFPGSYEHEFIDAETFAEWEIDYLKYDYCYHSPITAGEHLYRRMGLALANCGRDIVLSACSWGGDGTPDWIKTTGAHLWRSTGDIFDRFSSVRKLILRQEELQKTNGQGCFNDMDMLTVGMYGQGNVGEKDQLMNDDEYRTQFSAWCMMGSPLMIGCDIRNVSDVAKAIYTNKEAIAIDQDPAYRQVFSVASIYNSNNDCRIYVRFLDGGDIAIGFFNLGDTESRIGFNLDQLGINRTTGRSLLLHEIWTGENEEVCNETFGKNVKAHCCKFYRASLTKTR